MALIKIPKEMGSTPGIVDNSNATAITIDSSENVGIGNTAPDALLTLGTDSSSSQAGYIRLRGYDTNEGNIYKDATYAIHMDTDSNAEPIRIDGSEVILGMTGNVGIGTSSPTDLLSVGTLGSTASPALTIGSATNGQGQIYFGDGAGAARYRGYIEYVHSSDYMALATEATERLRIDSSGNLLVAKTTTAFGTAGLRFAPTGAIDATVSGDGSLFLNRLSSDGGLAYFYKNGATVGSIFSGHGGTQVGIGTNTTGITFNPATRSMMPANPSSTNPQLDATLDIGFSSVRWRDLYLSGGAYLGGTGAANKLDDYEEGTWTAGISAVGGNTTSVNTVHGYYTKIGRNVNIYFYLNQINLALLTSGTYVILTGLPFQCDAYSDFQWSYHRGGNALTGGYIQSGTSYVYLVDSSGIEIQQAANETITALIGSAIYMTNS